MSDRLKPMSDDLGATFQKLERSAQHRANLAELVRSALTGPEKDHVLSVSYRGELLIVLVDSASWCAQIRYAQRAVLAKLNAAGENRFTKFKVKVGKPGSKRR